MNYEQVKIERKQLLNKINKLSDSELHYEFGFGSILSKLYEIAENYHNELKKSGHHDIDSYRQLDTKSLADVKAFFNHIDEHMIDSAALKHLNEEYRLLGHLDIMLHILENKDHKIDDRTAGRVKVTERLNMTTTRL